MGRNAALGAWNTPPREASLTNPPIMKRFLPPLILTLLPLCSNGAILISRGGPWNYFKGRLFPAQRGFGGDLSALNAGVNALFTPVLGVFALGIGWAAAPQRYSPGNTVQFQ